MIEVSNFNRTLKEPLIHILDNFSMTKTVEGDLTLSLSTVEYLNGIKNYGYELLNSTSFLTVEGYEFFATNFSKSEYSKNFNGICSFFKHSKTRKNGTFDGVRNVTDVLLWIFNGIDYQFTIDADLLDEEVTLFNFGNDNVVSLLNRLLALKGWEYEIQPQKYIHVERKIGHDDDFQFRYKYNVSDVVLNEDMTDLYTKITGKGANGLEVTYTSPNVSIFGVLEAEPIEDENFETQEELTNYLKTQILDAPLLSIESTTYEMTERYLGETVWYIYEPLDIEMQTRIISQTFKWINDGLVCDSVVFGNSLPSTNEDLIINRAEGQKELEGTAVLQTRKYNGVRIDKEEGVRVDRNDGIVTVWLNATEGIKVVNDTVVKFYVDINGNVVLDGRLKITNGDGTTTLLDAFLDTFGGRLDLYDSEGNLNVRTGSEERGGGQKGGILKLYDDGEYNKRVELGALSAYGGNGSVAVYDSDNKAKAGIFAVPGSAISGMLYVNDGLGQTVSYLSASYGMINNQQIATQDWVITYVNSVINP